MLAGCGQAPPARAPAPAAPPAPEERLGSDAVRLAARLTEVEAALDGDIDAWRAHGDPAAGPPPAAVTLGALYEQRVVRRLAVDRRLAAGVLPRLPGGLQRFIRAGVLALRDLRRLSGPPRRHRFKVGPAQPADRLLRAYGEAQRRFRVGWHVLAAVAPDGELRLGAWAAPRRDAALDDLLDAYAALWSARRHAAGGADVLGDGERDERGLLMQMVT